MRPDDRETELRHFIWFDVALSVAGSAVSVAVWAWISRAHAILALAALVLAAGAMMARGLAPLRRGDLAGAVSWVAAGNWAAALGVSALASFAMPVMTMTALLPTVLAVPYVSRRRLVRFIAVSTGVVVVAALLAPHDIAGVAARTPTWAQRSIVVGFLPLLAGLVATTAWHNGDALRTTLDAVLDANRRLRASESALAAQAGELAASRTRLATAGDAERRRIERNLHDGAQQRLLAVSVRLQGVRSLCRRSPDAAVAALDDLAAEVRATVRDLRDLAHGLYPSVLSDHGLAAALAADVARSGLRHDLAIEEVGRRAPAVESSVYFCVAEALHNAMRHAGPAATVRVVLQERGDELDFEVADDGPGFRGGAARDGRGLQNMRDRMASIGGTLDIAAAPGGGVRIRGRAPAPGGRRTGVVHAA